MNEKTKFKLAFALLAFIVAHFYPNIREFLKFEFDLPFNADEATTTSSKSGANTIRNGVHSIKHDIINSWRDLIIMPKSKLKIAIGLNTNVDLILPALDLFEQLKETGNKETQTSNNHHILKSVNDFRSTFKYHFSRGSAAERTFLNKADFEHVLNAGLEVDNKHWYVGGNAALMAQGLAKRARNSEIYLFGPVGPRLNEMLLADNSSSTPLAIRIAEKSRIESDEVHLILEYGVSETFEGSRAPRSNRFIVTHDYYNSRMEMLDEFFNFVTSYQPDLIILSGLHLLENQDDLFRKRKLSELSHLLAKNDLKKSFSHLELASIGDQTLMSEILENDLLESINSLGLNEQELLFLAHAAGPQRNAPHADYYHELDATHPDLGKIIDVLEWILTEFGVDNKAGIPSKLSRIHFHCLVYHIIVETRSSSTKTIETNIKSSLVSGAKVASKQACGFDFDDETSNDKLEQLVDFRFPPEFGSDSDDSIYISVQNGNVLERYELNAAHPVVEFTRQNGRLQFVLTPILVCRNPIKTVGLGDAISSNGLFYSFS